MCVCVRVDLRCVCVIICFLPRQAVWQSGWAGLEAGLGAGLKNKGTVDTQPRRFQLSRTPNNTFPLTISGRASQVGIASLSGSLRQWIKEQRQKNIPLSLSLLFLCFWLITVDWHFSLCCSSMLILFFAFLFSPSPLGICSEFLPRTIPKLATKLAGKLLPPLACNKSASAKD